MSNASFPGHLQPALLSDTQTVLVPGRSRLGTCTQRRVERRLVFGVALVLVLAVLALHRLNPRCYVGYHGLTHAAVTFNILDGNLPPTNPFAADLPLPYYWVYHVLLAIPVAVLGCTPLAAAELLNVLTLIALVLLLVRMGRWLLGSTPAALLAIGLVLFGSNPAGPLVMLYRVITGEVGLSIDAFTRSPLHPLLRASFLTGDVRWGGAFFYHLLPTSRAIGMLGGAATAFLACRALTRPTWPRTAGIALLTAITCGLQPIVGVGVAFALGVSLVWMRLFRGRRAFPDGPTLMRIGGSLTIGVAASFPTYRQLLTGEQVGLPIESSLMDLLAKGLLIVGVLGVLPLVLTGMAYRRGCLRRPQLQLLALAGLVLLVVGWVTHVPHHREHTFFNTGLYLLALPAAAVCRRTQGGPAASNMYAWRWLWRCGAIMTPAAGVLILAVVLRRPIDLDAGGSLVRYPGRADAAAVYDWLAHETPANAVILYDVNAGAQTGFYGSESELPAMTRRSLFVDRSTWIIPNQHPAIAEREAIVAATFAGKAYTDAQRNSLRGLRRPLYVLCRKPAEDQILSQSSSCLFRSGKYTIYALHTDAVPEN